MSQNLKNIHPAKPSKNEWRDLHCEKCETVIGKTDLVSVIYGGAIITQPVVKLLCTDKGCHHIKKFHSPTNKSLIRFITENDIAELIKKQ